MSKLEKNISSHSFPSIDPKEKIACITLDLETDYGGRANRFNILKKTTELNGLRDLFLSAGVPVSAFIQTDLLVHYPDFFKVINGLFQDFHCHSHTHNFVNPDTAKEIAQSLETFKKFFGYEPIGYRAPQGVVGEREINLLKEAGFKFDASVFPAWRPGTFNNCHLPDQPFCYQNGLWELPFAVIPKIRYIISLSYLKLIGFSLFRLGFKIFGLPQVLIFDSHLHDYIIDEESFSLLPLKMKIIYSRNKKNGLAYFEKMIKFLKDDGYRFMTMTELHHYLQEKI